MSKISALTKEQTDLLPLYRDRGLTYGLDTSRMDRGKAKSLIDRVYIEILQSNPVPVVFANGPNEALSKYVSEMGGEKDKNIFTYSMGGSFDSSWVISYSYYKDVLKLRDLSHVDLMVEITKEMGCWVPFDKACLVIEKPEIIKKDDENLSHCEDGPAIRYADGFEVYIWHGQRVPKDWIMDKENLSPETALTWPQIEQRRAAAEIIGWNNVLKRLPNKVIDKDDDPTIGELIEVEIPEIGKEWFLRVLCGTGREFAIPVPRNQGFKTALDANAWTYGMDGSDFLPEVRT